MANWRFSEQGMRIWDTLNVRAELTGKYYIYSDELKLIEAFLPEIVEFLPKDADITFIDLGIGSKQIIEDKLGKVFELLGGRVKQYIGVDIVPEIIAEAKEAFAELYPDMKFASSLQDFYKDKPNLPTRNHSLAAMFGLTMLNIPVDPRVKGLPEDALREMLKRLLEFMEPGETLLMTLDMNQNDASIKEMYEEQEEIWRHMLNRIKHELKPSEEFDPDGFDFVVDKIDETSTWVRKYVAQKDMNFWLGDEYISIKQGQEFFPHNAFKPNHTQFVQLAHEAGWSSVQSRKLDDTNLAIVALTR